MRLGIIGSEASKFTSDTEKRAKAAIHALLGPNDVVVSGACHLGGIDLWAAEIGREKGLEVVEFPPKEHSWEKGYKPRNIQIAENSDIVVCITLKTLPKTYTGMRFKMCYHCGTPPEHHVKSGGCWTMKYARKIGKPTNLIVIEE